MKTEKQLIAEVERMLNMAFNARAPRTRKRASATKPAHKVVPRSDGDPDVCTCTPGQDIRETTCPRHWIPF